ncbi:MAG: PAS domain S-box protein, partial [Polyangiaceae bacterium]
ENNAADTPIKLFGSDVSAKAIDAARSGRYPAGVELEVSASRLQAFFFRVGESYQIRKDVRDLCVFAKHDATRDPPFSRMDLISCRNLMIYLGPNLQDRLLPVLHYALKEPGFLVLGTSETTRGAPGFAVLDPKHKLYTRTAVPRWLPPDFTVAPVPDPTHFVTAPRPLDAYREADRLVLAEFAPAGVVITDDLVIIQFRGKTGAYLEPASGAATFDVLRMAREELRVPLRQAIDEARAERAVVRKAGVFLATKPEARTIDIEVIPFVVPSTQQHCFVVLFQEQPRPATRVQAQSAAHPPATEPTPEPELRKELASTRGYLQSVIDQLEASNDEQKAANEEITSSNEELRSTNEELQMTKEELQATNEELLTVNEEVVVRNAATIRINDDLNNVLTSTDIPILLLGGDSRIRRFTPAASKSLGLATTDISRPIAELGRLLPTKIGQMAAEVVEHVRAERAEIQDEAGRWFAIAARPYVTLDKRIEGTVVTALDIDEMTKAAQRVTDARAYAESIIDTVRESLLVLDAQGRVRSANRAFYKLFGATPQQVEGRMLGELGHGELNDEGLVKHLAELGELQVLEDLRLERDLPGVGSRVLLLNARRIRHAELVLLAIEDVTTRVRAEEALSRTELEFRNLLSYAPAPVLTVDSFGSVLFANDAACKLFGFDPGSLVGTPVDQLVPERRREGHAARRSEYLAAASPRPMGRGRQIHGRKRDGTEFPLEVALSPMASNGQPLVVCFITDLTDREKLEQEKIRGYQEKLQQMAFEAARVEQRERRRIAVDLHDHIGQALALAKIKLEATLEALGSEPRRVVDEVVQLVAQSIVDTRSLTFELSPPILYDLGLKPALSWLVEDVEKRCGISIELETDDDPVPLDDERAALVFRAVRELLMNVFKHAKSPTAKVVLQRHGPDVVIGVQDQGVGFDVTTLTSQGPQGFGLFSLREQIGRLGGTVEIASDARVGTSVSLRVPILHPAGSASRFDGTPTEAP